LPCGSALPPPTFTFESQADMIFEIEPFDNPDRIRCDSNICDGRPAKWAVTDPTGATSTKKSCRLHLGHFIEDFTVRAGKTTIRKGRRAR
jgi:hypothetical protein